MISSNGPHLPGATFVRAPGSRATKQDGSIGMDLGIGGKVAIVTGGDSGMGYSSAEHLLREGVKVLLTDKPGKDLDDAARRLGDLGPVQAIGADLTDPQGAARLVAAATEAFGAVHMLVHAAGITGPTGDFLAISDEQWQDCIAVDLMSSVRMCRAVIPAMQAARWGRIVLFCSEDAIVPYPDELPYCACKAAVLNLSKGLSKAYAQDGILVNAVSPAYVASPMTDAMMTKRSTERGESFDEAVQSFLAEERPHLELRRRGRPEEIAAAVAFLCSERASFIVGTNLRVDGGSVPST